MCAGAYRAWIRRPSLQRVRQHPSFYVRFLDRGESTFTASIDRRAVKFRENLKCRMSFQPVGTRQSWEGKFPAAAVEDSVCPCLPRFPRCSRLRQKRAAGCGFQPFVRRPRFRHQPLKRGFRRRVLFLPPAASQVRWVHPAYLRNSTGSGVSFPGRRRWHQSKDSCQRFQTAVHGTLTLCCQVSGPVE